jgi:hypothetical protein
MGKKKVNSLNVVITLLFGLNLAIATMLFSVFYNDNILLKLFNL